MKRKTLLWLAVIIALLIAGYFFFNKPKYTEVEITSLKKGDIEEVISSSGNIESETLVKISSDVSGELTAIYVAIGDTVRIGDVLAQIRPDNYKSATERAEATLNAQKVTAVQTKTQIEQSELKLQKASTDLERAKLLVQKEIGTKADLIAAQSSFDIARKEVETARSSLQIANFNAKSALATLKDAKQNLLKTELLSPINGIVLNVISKKGERVVGTSQMAGTNIMNLAEVNNLQVKIQINENDVNRVKQNQIARVRVEAAEDIIFNGKVKSVSSINKDKTTSDAVTEYEATITLPQELNKDNLKLLKIGMTATVDVITEQKKKVDIIPVQSILYKTDSTNPNPDGTYNDYEYVYLYKDNMAIEKKVVSGISNSALIEVKSGLSNRDTILIGPYDVLISKDIRKKKLIKQTNKEK